MYSVFLKEVYIAFETSDKMSKIPYLEGVKPDLQLLQLDLATWIVL